MKVREVVRLLEMNRWRLVRQKGSHRAFRHPVIPSVVTVPGDWNDDLPIGTLKINIRKSGVEIMKFAVVFEKADSNWAAYVPDLPGCITTGSSLPETKRNIREAVALHLEAMREVGEPIPEPTTDIDFVELETVA